LLDWIRADAPFLLFLAAIMAGAWFGGLGAGLLATALAAILSNFYMHPVGRFDISDPNVALRMALFATEGAFVSFLCAHLHAARDSVAHSARQARALEQQILEIGEEQRRQIGHDLHDGLGQHLTGTALLAKSLCERLRVSGEAEPATDAARIEQLVNQAISQTRDLARGLSPVDLRSGGLTGALRELALWAERLFNIQCAVERDGDEPSLTPEEATHLYRIVQEAISNAVRHGQAKHVVITVATNRRDLIVSVSDDGTGIIPASAPTRGGMGIKIMEHRAIKLRGAVTLAPRPTGGTVVTCTIANNRSRPL
jgi:two-component system sensor kinase FixL